MHMSKRNGWLNVYIPNIHVSNHALERWEERFPSKTLEDFEKEFSTAVRIDNGWYKSQALLSKGEVIFIVEDNVILTVLTKELYDFGRQMSREKRKAIQKERKRQNQEDDAEEVYYQQNLKRSDLTNFLKVA